MKTQSTASTEKTKRILELGIKVQELEEENRKLEQKNRGYKNYFHIVNADGLEGHVMSMVMFISQLLIPYNKDKFKKDEGYRETILIMQSLLTDKICNTIDNFNTELDSYLDDYNKQEGKKTD